ncbi:centromere-associated protein E isoform X1 [Danaus plexippus]|uniref:centromere-associated protein E isoform X1 n=1 Tax=Danaus plexippus TaxID=13037 RepID=UPI002AAFAC05|nr:centromere-associated protein E isoform X1 [Danaus plexippus]
MHHMYPMAKGDPLCPLGFHPQVRWPTRCKRCFRDYKEHGGRKKEDDFAASTPSLSSWNSPSSRSRDENNGAEVEKTGRGWASSTNLSITEVSKKDDITIGLNKKSTSWTSTPDLGSNEEDNTTAVTFSLKLPKRRSTGPLPSLDTGQNNTETVTVRRPSPSPPPTVKQPDSQPSIAQITINKNDSLAERVRKMQLMKAQSSFDKESSVEKERERRSASRSKEEEKSVKPKEEKSYSKEDVSISLGKTRNQSISKPPIRGGPISRDKEESEDEGSTITTDTDVTLVDPNIKEYQEQIESLKSEVDFLKKRCERVEKEKSDILLRRLANIDNTNKYSTGRSSENLKLQKKVNELTTQNEDLKDEKKHLSLRIKEMEVELESRPSIEAQTKQIEQLRAKLLAAETLCEELMDENEDMKKELRDLEEEIEEMQDNFREDQADEYSSLRRELEQTIKNCRVLSFKLKKTERRAEQLEQEKADQEKKLLEIVGGADGLQRENRIKELEQEVARSTEVALRLQRELAEAKTKSSSVSGVPPANVKKQTTDGKISRSSLTRGGSQEDAAQLLRDLQDSLEREADLREQLRNAEEEAIRYPGSFSGKRNLPPPHSPPTKLHPPPNLAVTDNNNKSMLEIQRMQHVLEKKLSSLDINKLSIGISESHQTPQDYIDSYSEGCQTDTVLFHDVANDTKKITFDCNIQIDIDLLDMYSQTEKAFVKNKNIQTECFKKHCFTQIDKRKNKNACCQSSQYIFDKSIQIGNTVIKSFGDKSTLTDIYASTSMSDDNHAPLNQDSNIEERIQKSDSPPLSSDKGASSSNQIQFPFALFNPLAARLPIVGRKLSPTPPNNRLAIEAPNEKDEGISDEEDPAELRILLELNEQEAAVLRKKVEELEQDRESLRKQVKELSDKISSTVKSNTNTVVTLRKTTTKANNLAEEKVKVLEDEIAELRKKLIEKERDCERLHAELSLTQKKPKASLIKSKSLDGGSEQQNVDLKRQLQVIEQEANVLRAKTQSLEADNEKLQAENKKLQLLKSARNLKSDKSVEQNASKVAQLDKELKDALAKIKELEVNKDKEEKAEKKVRFGDVLKKEAESLKPKVEELDKLKISFNKLEKEKLKLQTTLKELKEDAMKTFKPRTPKKITDITTKLQMKRMVEDLESEIGELYVIMKNAGLSQQDINTKTGQEKDIENIKAKLSKTETELTNEKNRLQNEISKLKDLNSKLESEKKSFSNKYKALEEEKNNAAAESKSLKEEKNNLEAQLAKLNLDLKKNSTQQAAMSDCMKKIEELKTEIDNKDKEIDKLKKQVDSINKLEQDKSKLLKEVGDKTKKLTELEKKLKELEEKCKRTEKLLATRKDRVAKLEKELSQEKEEKEVLTNSNRRMSVDFTTENDGMKTKLFNAESKVICLETDLKEMKCDYENKITSLESTIAAKDNHIKQLEDALRETSNQKYDEALSAVEIAQVKEKYEKASRELKDKEKELASAKKDLSSTEKDYSKLQSELTQLKSDISKYENEKKDLENKLQTEKKESNYWEKKASELDSDIQAERKKIDRMRANHDKDIKNKEAELATLRGKLKVLEQTSGAGTKRLSEIKQEHEEKVKKLEHSLAVEKAEYEELTGKYELLEEEHVVTKARLTVEKEKAQSDLLLVQKELNTKLAEYKSIQENYESESEAWNKEKAELQKEISSLQDRLCGGGWEVERARLSARLEQLERELRGVKDSNDVLSHHHDLAKKELEEARRKLEDYEKISKVQRTLTADNAELERELAALNNRLEQADKARKNEVAETKARYDSQMNSLRDEMKSLHNQVSRFRRERDNYKQMLEAAQKTIAEDKSGEKRAKRNSISSTDEEEYRNKVAILEQQLACAEDELCEARLLASKLNTELVSERSTAEVRLAEMQSRLNEYEEDRLLSSGRGRLAGLATRMELAWHKERDEQNRLLHETSTLARDLRQTLFEVEREREKERLDMKRRIDQLKRTTEEETEEAKKKVTELQCDLLELRDAHAKLRTANEKLRRDKERHDRDRDQNKLLVASLKRAQQEDDKVITQLVDTIDDLMKQNPSMFRTDAIKPEKSLMTPTPPRRNRSSKSRSRSATPETSEAQAASDAQATAVRLKRLTDELRASRIAERQRRQQTSARRAMSTEPRDTLSVTSSRTPSRAPSLKKRSISLEQTTKEQSSIWKTVEDSSVSSMQSLDGDADVRLFTMQRDNSLDSRLSGGSTQSDVLPTEKKKKKGLFDKLKKMTKSRSIDDHVNSEVADFRPIGTVSQGSDSDMSTTGSKRDLRGRLSGMFSRKGQLSRGNSKDQSPERPGSATGSTTGSATVTKPILRNASSSTLSRASPAKPASLSTRASSATPGTKRKGK